MTTLLHAPPAAKRFASPIMPPCRDCGAAIGRGPSERLCRYCWAAEEARQYLAHLVELGDGPLLEAAGRLLGALSRDRRAVDLLDDAVERAGEAVAVRVVRDPVIRPLDDDEPDYPF